MPEYALMEWPAQNLNFLYKNISSDMVVNLKHFLLGSIIPNFNNYHLIGNCLCLCLTILYIVCLSVDTHYHTRNEYAKSEIRDAKSDLR